MGRVSQLSLAQRDLPSLGRHFVLPGDASYRLADVRKTPRALIAEADTRPTGLTSDDVRRVQKCLLIKPLVNGRDTTDVSRRVATIDDAARRVEGASERPATLKFKKMSASRVVSQRMLTWNRIGAWMRELGRLRWTPAEEGGFASLASS